jgi:FkbM family methyltransferase
MLLNLSTLVDKYNMKISGVLHIGAHFGEENSAYNCLGITNRIFFEPLKSNFQVLKNNIEKEHLLLNIALGNENKKVLMNVETANGGQSSSILNPALHLVQYPHIKFETQEEVEMKRLDDLGMDLSSFNFINIDVQGYELEVFKGAEKTLTHIDYIMSEINRDEVYQNGARVEQLIEFLSPYGFELVEQTWDGETWGDGFFVNKRKFKNTP